MANVQDLEKQRDALENFLHFLEQFTEQLGNDLASYQRYVDNLLVYGGSIQSYEQYNEEFRGPMVASLTAIIDGIQEYDYTFLRAYIEKIEDAIEQARTGSGDYQ